MSHIPYQTFNWEHLSARLQRGASGTSTTKSVDFDGLRIRIVEYSPGYVADHWCRKGHIVYCLEGEMISELENGEAFTLTPGMMYVVSDNLSSHRSHSKEGVKLLIIDGDFLK